MLVQATSRGGFMLFHGGTLACIFVPSSHFHALLVVDNQLVSRDSEATQELTQPYPEWGDYLGRECLVAWSIASFLPRIYRATRLAHIPFYPLRLNLIS